MRMFGYLRRLLRFGVKCLEWALGRAYPWTSTPPHQLLAFLARRAYARPGAHYRAIYALAAGALKYRERLYADRINFSARVTAPIDSAALLNAALWQEAILATPPMASAVHANIRVHDAERAQLDRLMSVLLMSDHLRTINLFFDDAAAREAQVVTQTVAEESRRDAYSLNAVPQVEPEWSQQADWSAVFSNRTGFERNVNSYLKIAHAGKLVVALGLPETDEGFCDPWLPEWREAVRSFEASGENISFVVLNAVSPAALLSDNGSLAFARNAGLTLAEAICLARKADAFIGQTDVFGLAALTAKRPGICVGTDTTPAQACARVRELLDQSAAHEQGARTGANASARLPVRRFSPKARGETYTLLIPTYNRPDMLERLLRYLERERASFPILVADSSKPETQAHNKNVISAVDLNVTHAPFDETTDPYVKMRAGLTMIGTPYSSICADDDLIVLSALPRCVEALDRDRSAAVAHGYYFNFRETETFDLSFVVYRGKSIDDPQPLARLKALFAAYEAVLYGVFRTEHARRALRDVETMDSVLGKELLSAGVSVIAGKALRIANFYYGRNTGESFSYTAWHPHQVLAHQPEALFAQYPQLRDRLMESLGRSDACVDKDTAVKTMDLVFLRYLEPFLRHDVLDLMLDLNMRGEDSNAIVDRVWDVFVRSRRTDHPVEPLLDARGAFSPATMGGGHARDYRWDSRRRDGTDRRYKIFFEFLFPDRQSVPLANRETVLNLLTSLDAY
jgi:glycosyltransferase domain-containing protein